MAGHAVHHILRPAIFLVSGVVDDVCSCDGWKGGRGDLRSAVSAGSETRAERRGRPAPSEGGRPAPSAVVRGSHLLCVGLLPAPPTTVRSPPYPASAQHPRAYQGRPSVGGFGGVGDPRRANEGTRAELKGETCAEQCGDPHGTVVLMAARNRRQASRLVLCECRAPSRTNAGKDQSAGFAAATVQAPRATR